MKIITLALGDLAVNTYIVFPDARRECVVIDPGYGFERIEEELSCRMLYPKAILLTHSHFDHIESVERIRERYGCPIYVSKDDVEILSDSEKNLSRMFSDTPIEITNAEKLLSDGEEFTVAGLNFEVIHTPGHSKGSLVYKCEDVLFTGDTLFDGCCGRWDFWSGSAEELRSSLDRLFSFTENFKVYPGHGNSTTLNMQRHSYKYFV